jgi:hypothetical protein
MESECKKNCINCIKCSGLIHPKDIMKEIAKIYIELGKKLDELNRMINK